MLTKVRESRHAVFLTTLLAILVGAGCAQLPSLKSQEPSLALRATSNTPIGQVVTPLANEHPGQSGVVPLRAGPDAFAARVLLADAAQRSLDVQYYIWHADMSGVLLLDALRRAAARGVRVRLLLDDINTSGMDATLAAVAALPNVELRLFNPIASRQWRTLGLIADFSRLNRRMHNKAFIADNQVAIVGGRNIGDEYFGAGREPQFFDLDLFAIGPIVGETSENFDRYWNSASAYPATSLLVPATPEDTLAFDSRLRAVEQDPASRHYQEALATSPFVSDMLAHRLQFAWAHVSLVSDDPAKVLGAANDQGLVWTKLKLVVARPRTEFTLSSPYFVPGVDGAKDFVTMARSGVRVVVLTNSLEATDVPAVHAGYARHRVELLRAGVELYELKRGVDPHTEMVRRRLPDAGPAGFGGSGGSGMQGSSGSSLHAKAFTVDEDAAFVGSFNFDPRSAKLNSEMGFVVDSPALTQSMLHVFKGRLKDNAYRVRLTEGDSLQWIETIDGREVIHEDEPGTTFWRRLGISVLSLLPIDWLL